jgi:hypothetical protein
VRVHSFTFSFTPGLFLLAHNLANPCLGHEPKARVVTETETKVFKKIIISPNGKNLAQKSL